MNMREKAERIIASNQGGYPQEVAKAYLDQQWIPVSERLPEKAGRYWVWSDMVGDTEMLFTENGEWLQDQWEYSFTVKYWMPLPPPPESE